MKRVFLVSLLLTAILHFCIASFIYGQDQKMRMWTSEPNSSGKVFKAKGYLKSVSEDCKTVILVIKGKEKVVEVERLTQEDKDYIRDFWEKCPKEGKVFVFLGKELPMSRPLYGICLGETIQDLSQVTSITKPHWQDRADEFLENYDVYYSDDLVGKMMVYTSQGCIMEIVIKLRDTSLENYKAVEKVLESKYKKEGLRFVDDQENGARVLITPIFTEYGGSIHYSYVQMADIHKEATSKYRVSKVGDRL